MRHVVEHVAERLRIARHFEADVEALGHAELLLHVLRASRCATLTVRVAPSFFGELEPVVVDVGDDDVAGAGMAATAAAIAPIGPAPVISTSSPTMSHCKAVWTALPNGSKIEATSRSMPSAWCQTLALGMTIYSAKAPGRLTPTPLVIGAEMAAAGHAVAAAAADDMALAGDDHAGRVIVDVVADLDDLADEFVADHHRHRDRLLRPFVPFVDVQIGAADRGALHLDLDVVDAGLGLGHVLEPEAAGALLVLDQAP